MYVQKIPVCHLTGPNSYIFTYVFAKTACVGGRRPQRWLASPHGKSWIHPNQVDVTMNLIYQVFNRMMTYLQPGCKTIQQMQRDYVPASFSFDFVR